MAFCVLKEISFGNTKSIPLILSAGDGGTFPVSKVYNVAAKEYISVAGLNFVTLALCCSIGAYPLVKPISVEVFCDSESYCFATPNQSKQANHWMRP